jgi:serine/threonine protein kinase
LMGTPEYMAPELAEEPATTSSDIYALGIVLYQMLTGKTPFQGSNPLSIYWKHIRELPIPPSLLNPAISYAVERVVLRALEKSHNGVSSRCRRWRKLIHRPSRTLSSLRFSQGRL